MEACHPGLIIIPGLTIFTVTTICIYIYMVATIMRRWGLWQDLSSSDCDSFSRSELLVPLLQPCLQVILEHLWELRELKGEARRKEKLRQQCYHSACGQENLLSKSDRIRVSTETRQGDILQGAFTHCLPAVCCRVWWEIICTMQAYMIMVLMRPQELRSDARSWNRPLGGGSSEKSQEKQPSQALSVKKYNANR